MKTEPPYGLTPNSTTKVGRSLSYRSSFPVKENMGGMRTSVLLSLLLTGLGTGCGFPHKPGAQLEAEQLAQRIREETGSVEKLRKWFSELQSAAPSKDEGPQRVVIPSGLDSEWWRQARAGAVWSNDGRLEYITVMDSNVWEMVRIGPPGATADDLHLAGPPPVFPSKVADGIYAFIRYK